MATVITQQLIDVLTMEDAAQRTDRFRFDLLGPDLELIGELDVQADAGVDVDTNMNRSVKRTLSGLVLPPNEIDEVNPLTDRLRPVWVHPDTGLEVAMGVFLFENLDVEISTAGDIARLSTMSDQGLILEEPLPANWSKQPGAAVREAMSDLVDALGFPASHIAETGAQLGKAVNFVVGEDTYRDVLQFLCTAAGFYSPHFDKDGTLQLRAVPDLGISTAEFDYDTPARVYQGSILRRDARLRAPNRYVAIDTSNADQYVSGVWDVPSEAPHSIAKRGRAITSVTEVQVGFTTTAELTVVARARGLTDNDGYEWVDFQAPLDPRHDHWAVVEWNGVRWREQRHRMTLAPGGPHLHELRRVYQEDTF